MIKICQAESTDAAQDRIEAILDAEAEKSGNPFSMTRLTYEAWDGDTYLGGLMAKAGMTWMFVDLLAVQPEAQGRCIGAQLLQQAEDAARARGLAGVWLDTFSFQAPAFYRKHGYREFGQLSDESKGITRHFFAKSLAPHGQHSG